MKRNGVFASSSEQQLQYKEIDLLQWILQFLFLSVSYLFFYFQCSKHPNQSHTNNKEFVVFCCCLMFFSIIQFLVSLCCSMSLLFHFHPQGSLLSIFICFFIFLFLCCLFCFLGSGCTFCQFLFRKYFIYL